MVKSLLPWDFCNGAIKPELKGMELSQIKGWSTDDEARVLLCFDSTGRRHPGSGNYSELPSCGRLSTLVTNTKVPCFHKLVRRAVSEKYGILETMLQSSVKNRSNVVVRLSQKIHGIGRAATPATSSAFPQCMGEQGIISRVLASSCFAQDFEFGRRRALKLAAVDRPAVQRKVTVVFRACVCTASAGTITLSSK